MIHLDRAQKAIIRGCLVVLPGTAVFTARIAISTESDRFRVDSVLTSSENGNQKQKRNSEEPDAPVNDA